MPITLRVDGRDFEVPDRGASLLEVLRDDLGLRSAKDGCSPQGQCGCCTVLVDGTPRVACVTPARRVAGREVTTLDGLGDAPRWAGCFAATGGSQCGFCTPGIIVRLHALAERAGDGGDVDQALLSHLCRCTGWNTVAEAYALFVSGTEPPERDLAGAAERARLEGGATQAVGPDVPRGEGGFADDTAPLDALVAVRALDGTWVVGESLTEARAAAGKVQGRRTTETLRHPVSVPDGDWDLTLQTTWVEPAYLEPDASWCEPGGQPVSPLANGGAFGGKTASEIAAVAKRLADEHGRAVRAVYSREDTVRFGPKRPPMAAGVRRDGSGILRVAKTPGIAAAIGPVAPGVRVEEVDVLGPPTSATLRAAGWAEAAILVAALSGRAEVTAPNGARASAFISGDGSIDVHVECGQVLDEVVLRSYCIGAAHMALGWVRSEGIVVDETGEVHDLTIRSFGILRARDMPVVRLTMGDSGDEPVNGSDAVFAAVAAAAWMSDGLPPRWPTRRGGGVR